jgi:phosphoribosyl 1,2-cyclic phosphodiesterase
MKVTCYGSRGSIPSPGPGTLKYGGNTTCYYVEAGPFKIIIDAGSGIRQLSKDLFASGKGIDQEFIHLFTHYHHDHIQGLPFCGQYYVKNNKFFVHGHVPAGKEHGVKPAVEAQLSEQQLPPNFPVAHGAMPSDKVYHDHARQFSETFSYAYGAFPNSPQFLLGSVPGMEDKYAPGDFITITTIPVNHPDGCLGYMIQYLDKCFVFCTDHEPLRHVSHAITKACKGVDVDLFIGDGQYTEEELSTNTQCFGHGTAGSVIEQGITINAKLIGIHHHDPDRSDEDLDLIGHGVVNEKMFFVKEGDVWEL